MATSGPNRTVGDPWPPRSCRRSLHATPWLVAEICAVCFLLLGLSSAQTRARIAKPKRDATQPAATQAPSAQPVGAPILPLQLDGAVTLRHLNQTIRWYRNSTSGTQSVGLPSDAVYQGNAQNLAAQVVRLAFQSARAEAALIATQQDDKDSGSGQQATKSQNLAQVRARTSSKIEQLQSQLEGLNTQIASAGARRKASLTSQRDALQSELELQKALLDAEQKMAAFVENNGEVGGGFEGEINQLARAVPEVLGANESSTKTTGSAVPTRPGLESWGGLISQAMLLYDHVRAVHQIDTLVHQTDYTRELANQVRTPLRDVLRGTIQQSESLANQSPVTDPQQLQMERSSFQILTGQFKQVSAAMLPLSQELIVLDDSKNNFNEWRNSISRESKYILRSLLVRVFGIALALAAVLILSEVWRRVTFRYVGDPRRRRQFLVLRRVISGFLVAVVLTLGFVSQFSSLATFAGFITAGIAVGLQAVLLSVAAYFFIIGRYGIRVGDRISVAGITGDVADIGLVRLYLIELAGTGLDFYPTGRIVVFSNSVLFQTGTPLFKQIPGTEYTWHEVVTMVSASGNHKEAEQKLLAAVNSVYSKYREEIERQHAAIERRVDIQIDMPRPDARLNLIDAGLELVVRYPIEIRRAPDIDEEMTRIVLNLIATDPSLKNTVAGTPRIRSALKG